MTNTGIPFDSATPESIPQASPASDRKRVVFTMGGKGGVGKTAVTLALAEWFQAHHLPCTLLDLDTENKAVGSLNHYFSDATKINIHTPAGLDIFIDRLSDGAAPIILADMGAGSGHVAHHWFDSMYHDISALNISFTAIGVVTPDPASVDSVLEWAAKLQNWVHYLIVENHVSAVSDFTYWRRSQEADRFRDLFHPTVLSMEFRLSELENASRQQGLTLGRVADRHGRLDQLQRSSLVIRAQAYRRRFFAEIDKAGNLLVP